MDTDDENGEEVVEGKNPYQYIRTNNDVIVKIFNNTLSSVRPTTFQYLWAYFKRIAYVGPLSIALCSDAREFISGGNPHDSRAKPAEKTRRPGGVFLRFNIF